MSVFIVYFINIVAFFVEIARSGVCLAVAERKIVRHHGKIFYAVRDSDVERIFFAFVVLPVAVVGCVGIRPERSDNHFHAFGNRNALQFVEIVEAILNHFQRRRKRDFFHGRSRSGNEALYGYDPLADNHLFDRRAV